MKIDMFIDHLSKLNINLNEEQKEKLHIYYEYLIEYNSHTNLTNITLEEDVYLKHFYDSLTLVKAFDFKKQINLLDIGTGAGFPGMVLKIIFPNIDVYLLDSNAKKTTFLKNLAIKLDFNDINVVNSRAEDFIKEKREFFDIVVSRAVAKSRILIELGIPFLKINGLLLLMKASDEVTNMELLEAKKTLELLNSRVNNIINFVLPVEESKRNIVVIEKLEKTDLLYPRSYDKILKKPLK